jgi:hypothetical protein
MSFSDATIVANRRARHETRSNAGCGAGIPPARTPRIAAMPDKKDPKKKPSKPGEKSTGK